MNTIIKKGGKTVVVLMAACLMASCGDFLKETSQDEFEPKTIESYQELLNGEGYLTTATIDPVTNVMTDDVDGIAIPSYASSYVYSEQNLAYQSVYTWQPDMDAVLTNAKITGTYNSYQTLYKVVMTCNLTIDAINGGTATGTEDEHNQTLGEALALRAFAYFYLVNMYAKPYNTAGTTPDQLSGVPLVLEAAIKNEGPKRATVKAVYDQVTKDIEEACTLLDKEQNQSVGLFRFNYVSAHLLASRIYLYMENWDKVITHAETALKGAPALCNFNTYQLSRPTTPQNSTNGVMSKDFPETIFISGSHLGVISQEAKPWNVSDDLMNSYGTSDLRKKMFFYATNMYYPYWMAKYGTSEQGYTFRTSELYLNLAEAYAAKFTAGDAASGEKAIGYLNELRKNRYSDGEAFTLTTPEALTGLCRSERRKELCFEFQRWFDLRRYGMPEIKHVWYDVSGIRTVYTLKKNDLGYTLPIPDAALTQNTNLTQNELAPKRAGSNN